MAMAFKIYAERDVETAVDKLLVAYSKGEKETEENWHARDVSLEQFRAILAAGIAERFPETAVTQARRVVPAITNSMLSLRTQLAVKASRTACDLITALGSALDTLSMDQLTVTALKQCAQAKRIVAVAGAEVLETAIATAQTTRPLAAILSSLTDKNKDLRLIAAHMYLITLQHCTLTRPVVDGARDVLQRGLSDATPPVRETMRLAYWAWRAHVTPTVAETFLLSLDPAVTKLVRTSEAAASQHPKCIYRAGGALAAAVAVTTTTTGAPSLPGPASAPVTGPHRSLSGGAPAPASAGARASPPASPTRQLPQSSAPSSPLHTLIRPSASAPASAPSTPALPAVVHTPAPAPAPDVVDAGNDSDTDLPLMDGLTALDDERPGDLSMVGDDLPDPVEPAADGDDSEPQAATVSNDDEAGVGRDRGGNDLGDGDATRARRGGDDPPALDLIGDMDADADADVDADSVHGGGGTGDGDAVASIPRDLDGGGSVQGARRASNGAVDTAGTTTAELEDLARGYLTAADRRRWSRWLRTQVSAAEDGAAALVDKDDPELAAAVDMHMRHVERFATALTSLVQALALVAAFGQLPGATLLIDSATQLELYGAVLAALMAPDASAEVLFEGGEALAALHVALEPELLLPELLRMRALRWLPGVVGRVPADVLQPFVPELSALLGEACTSASVVQRKAVVDTLVDLHEGVLGDAIYDASLFPFVDDRLRRLVALYCEPADTEDDRSSL